MTLTFDLWPWEPFQQWLLSGYHICAICEISPITWREIASREIGVDGRLDARPENTVLSASYTTVLLLHIPLPFLMKLSARKRISCRSFSMSVPSDGVAVPAELCLRPAWDDVTLWSTSTGKLCFDVICFSVLYFSVTASTHCTLFFFMTFSVIKVRKSGN